MHSTEEILLVERYVDLAHSSLGDSKSVQEERKNIEAKLRLDPRGIFSVHHRHESEDPRLRRFPLKTA